MSDNNQYGGDQPQNPADVPPVPPVPPASDAQQPAAPTYDAQANGAYGVPQHDAYGAQPGSLSTPPPSPYGTPAPQPSGGKGFAITALVLAIIGAVLCFIPFAAFGGVVIVIVALILGIVALVKKKNGKGLSIASVIVAGVGLLAGIVVVFITFTIIALMGTVGTYQDELNQYMEENPELFEDDMQILEQPEF